MRKDMNKSIKTIQTSFGQLRKLVTTQQELNFLKIIETECDQLISYIAILETRIDTLESNHGGPLFE